MAGSRARSAPGGGDFCQLMPCTVKRPAWRLETTGGKKKKRTIKKQKKKKSETPKWQNEIFSRDQDDRKMLWSDTRSRTIVTERRMVNDGDGQIAVNPGAFQNCKPSRPTYCAWSGGLVSVCHIETLDTGVIRKRKPETDKSIIVHFFPTGLEINEEITKVYLSPEIISERFWLMAWKLAQLVEQRVNNNSTSSLTPCFYHLACSKLQRFTSSNFRLTEAHCLS